MKIVTDRQKCVLKKRKERKKAHSAGEPMQSIKHGHDLLLNLKGKQIKNFLNSLTEKNKQTWGTVS